MRQKTLRVFEVNDYKKLKAVLESKYELLKNHYFLLKEKNEEIINLLKEYNLSFFIVNSEAEISSTPVKVKKEIVEVIKEVPVEKIVEKEVIKNPKAKIFDKIIRSGEEINSNSNLIFLKRINYGAKIVSSSNIEIYDECEGEVICNGDYLIVNKNEKGTILFKGKDIGKIYKLTLFYEKDDEIVKKALL